jgi:hypothetical protein
MKNAISNAQPGGAHAARASTVPASGQNSASARPPILAREEATRRTALLTDLQSALAAQGIRSVLARHHRLVLGGSQTKCEPSGSTDPQLHIFTSPGKDIATASGSAYLFASGAEHPVNDPAQAVRHAIGRNDA